MPNNRKTGRASVFSKFADWLPKFVASDLFLKSAFVWFILQGLFFALTVKMGLPPDENYHLSFIKLFSENGLSPFLGNQENYYFLGEAVRTPFFLYHYLFSIPYLLINDVGAAYLPLRLLNLLIAVGSVYLVVKIADELKVSKLARNLSIFMLVSTLMFTFLSAAVSYDNLFVFLSLASILLLLRLLDEITACCLLLFVASVGAGSLVKLNFLAIAAIVVIVFLWHYRREYNKAWTAFRKSFADHKKTNIALSVVVVLLGVIALHRYGYNVVKYRTYAPACEQVLTVDQCRENALFVRNEAVYGPRKQKATKDPFEYAYDWLPLIQERIYGIYAHRQLLPNKYIFVWVQLLVPLTLIAVIRLWSRKRDARLSLAMGIILLYMFLVMLENYKIYNETGRFTFVMHGRYLFSILPLVYLVSNHYVLKLLSGIYVRGVFVLLSALIFLVSGLPTYLLHSGSDWYTARSAQILRNIEDSVR